MFGAALCAALVAASWNGGATARVSAAALPPSFSDTLVATVSAPTSLAFAANGRVLVTTQFGQLRVIDNDVLRAQPALDLAGSLCTNSEQGLLGIALDPAFATNGFVYLYYTRNTAGTCTNRVSRYVMSGDVVAPASETVLVDGIPSPAGNHNGGDLHFGKDGYLYVSIGDGGCDYLNDSGCAGANDASRDQHVLLGKILRITSTGGIPPTNPFVGAGTARCAPTGRTTPGQKCQETYAWGLRNPFRIVFDPNAAGTRFFINDVGQNDWEEVDDGIAGADYGWNVREGPCVNASRTNCGAPPAGMTNPISSYSHGECNAITGGAFVPNGIWPASYDGTYLYGDYTCGKIFLLTPNGTGGFTLTELGTGAGAVVNLAFGPAPVAQAPSGQALYYTNYNSGGEVRRIAYTGTTNRPPTASMTATPRFGATPLTVSFDGSASFDLDPGDTLTYLWSFGDGSPTVQTSTPTTTHVYTAATNVTASLTVRDVRGASSPPFALPLFPGDTPPQVSIDSPTPSQLFSVGQTVALHGTATDAEEGTLPPARLSWTVLKHHDTHTHPFLAPTAGNDVPIVGPVPEDLLAATNSYLEIQLTATDARGLTTTVTRNFQPHKVDVTLATSPAGLQLGVNGAPVTAPTVVTSWEGYGLALSASAQVDGGGASWVFGSWSDGGAASHTFTTPAAPATVTATFTGSSQPQGLVAAFGFNELSGLGVVDGSGSGNGGTVSGALRSGAGRFGGALSFDGVNDWVSVADSASLDVSRMTLEAWVRPSALGNVWRTVLFKERVGGLVYGLVGSQGSGAPAGQVDIGGERNAVGGALPLNVWSHLAATFDGSVVRLYVNGVLGGSVVVAGSIPASTGMLRIGGNSIWGEWFAGLIDEVRVYNRALTQTEIQTDLQTPVGAAGPPPPDTQAPTAPSSLTATPSSGAVDLSWPAASDNVGVVRYDVHRGTVTGFTPSAANRIAQPTSTQYRDAGLSPGTYYYCVLAFDAAGNASPPSSQASATVAAPPPPPPPPPPSGGLVAAFGFNELSGLGVVDGSGSGNGGTVSGALRSGAGRFGGALSFDGVNDWVSVADSASLDVSRMTLEAWVRPSALGNVWRTVLFKERVGGLVYGLVGSQGSGAPAGQVDIGGERNAVGGALPLNVWSHLAATFDGSVVRLYVNGVLGGSVVVAGSIPASTGMLRIGGNSIWGEWFAGLIDEVRVYNRALTQTEIQADMTAPL